MNKIDLGKTIFIPTGSGNISGSPLLTGELFYNINNPEYNTVKSAESIESKLDKTCVVISCKTHAVGLKYIKGPDCPELLFKTTDLKYIKKLSKKLGFKIINNEKLATFIINNTDEYSEIPVDCWTAVATLFADLIKKKDKWFNKKIKKH